MQMPRVQFTVRRMLTVVGLMAVALGVTIEGWRFWKSFSYRRQANSYARMVNYWRWQAGRIPELYPGWDHDEISKGLDRTIRWNLQMEDKYRQAASRPWETLPLDPPRP